jgi:hypothetical protein
LESAIADVAKSALVLPLELEVCRESTASEGAIGLRAADALIYRTVLRHAASDASAEFINQNSKDFASPTIYDELEQQNCRLIARFDDGLRYVDSVMKG